MPMSMEPCPTNRSEFYWDMVVFQVEDTFFKVPKQWFLEASPVFEDMFSLPPGNGADNAEGMSDLDPIRLEGYASADFECLLMIMHPTTKEIREGGPALTREQWTGVLKLSTAWKMKDIRAHAIEQLPKSSGSALSAIEKVRLARDHRVKRWLVDALCDLLSDSGGATALRLANILELDTLYRIIGVQIHAAADYGHRFKLTGDTYDVHLAEFLCPRCSASLFPNGATCRKGHTWGSSDVIHVRRGFVRPLPDGKYGIAVRDGPKCIGPGRSCFDLLAPPPLRCRCQLAMSKAGLQADPVAEIVLDLKRWKLGRLIEDAMHDVVAGWEETEFVP